MAEVRFFILSILLCIMSQTGPRSTVHILHQSTFLTNTHFSTYFVFIGHFFWMKSDIAFSFSRVGGDGLRNVGGTDSPTFVKDGGTSYLDQYPTWASAMFVQTVHL